MGRIKQEANVDQETIL